MSRPTVVMVPGLLCDEGLYADQIPELEEEAHVVVGDVSRGASMVEMARHVLEGAPDRFVLVGLSMGGYVALEVWRQAPRRVTALAMLDSSARPDRPEQTDRRRHLVDLARAGRFEAVLDELWPALVDPRHVDDVELRRRFDDMARRAGPDVFVRQEEAMIARPDSRPDLASVDRPTLVLCGRSDAITPLDGHEELAAAIPGADLVVLGGCGHLSSWERPDAVTVELRRLIARA